MIFKFKEFEITQKVNAHKVGTDSMILGAWTTGNPQLILDIGTGTGILALMTAQKNSTATITAIEPNTESCHEAALNFEKSAFSNQLSAINSRLQDFQPTELFDFIICNPPYFVDSTLSEQTNKNKARHTIDLSIEDLYKNINRLLAKNGEFNVVFPSDLLGNHLEFAKENNLYPKQILILKNENGKELRHLISFHKSKIDYSPKQLISKYANGFYSKEYVELTKDFHNNKLPVNQ